MTDIAKEVRRGDFTNVNAIGSRGPGNDYHVYEVVAWRGLEPPAYQVTIRFQSGNPYSGNVNGVEIEDLLAVCADRLTDLQAGKFPDPMDQMALEHIQAALTALEARAEHRKNRGVLGLHLK